MVLMKKTLILSGLLTSLVLISCQAPNTKESTTTNPSTSPSVLSSAPVDSLSILSRKELYNMLKCQIKVLDDGKPSVLEKEIDTMENSKPPVADSKAIETYTNHLNNIKRIYSYAADACKEQAIIKN